MSQEKVPAMNQLEKRVREAFSDATALQYAHKYLELIRSNSADADKATGRLVWTVFAIMFLFLLITSASVQEISIGPFKLALANFSIIHRLLPIAMAYFYLDLTTTFVRAETLTDVHKYLLSVLYPPIAKNKLDAFIVSTPSIYEVNYLAQGRLGIIQAILLLVTWILVLFVFFTPPILISLRFSACQTYSHG